VRDRPATLTQQTGDERRKPAPLLAKLAAEGKAALIEK
jgi:hypothetical protein